MPTYDYRCERHDLEVSVFQSISEYVHAPKRPVCPKCRKEQDDYQNAMEPTCDVYVIVPPMERKLSVNPAMSGLANALAGDRHYDGLAATDGTPIDSRTKHRQYMKNKGLAMASDFKETWKEAAREREMRRLGTYRDPTLKREITEQVMTAVSKTE